MNINSSLTSELLPRKWRNKVLHATKTN